MLLRTALISGLRTHTVHHNLECRQHSCLASAHALFPSLARLPQLRHCSSSPRSTPCTASPLHRQLLSWMFQGPGGWQPSTAPTATCAAQEPLPARKAAGLLPASAVLRCAVRCRAGRLQHTKLYKPSAQTATCSWGRLHVDASAKPTVAHRIGATAQTACIPTAVP